MRVVLVESNVKFLPQFDQHNMVDSTVTILSVVKSIYLSLDIFADFLCEKWHCSSSPCLEADVKVQTPPASSGSV